MDTDASQDPATREQHFYVGTAKFAFSHPKRGIVFVRDPITIEAAAKYDLSPLILYGLAPAGTAIHTIRFSAAASPISFLGLLQEAWTTAPGLRGRPDVLKVNRHVAKAAPGLAHDLERLGVKLVVADGKDKRFPASLRNGQNVVLEFGWRFRDGDPELNSIDALNGAAIAHHRQRANPEIWERRSDKALGERTRHWLALSEKHLIAALPTSLDWKSGPWLWAWEASLPPAFPRTFAESHGVSWLVAGQALTSEVILDADDEEDFDGAGDDGQDFAVEKAKLIADCWPNEPLAIAKALGITARELKWYLTGQAALSSAARLELLTMLSIEYESNYDDYGAYGPCALIANSVRSISAAYDELTCGGDLEYSFEALPAKGTADPSWRYLVFKAYSKCACVIMIPRGSVVAEQFNDRTFINFDGQMIVKAEVYRDIVASCGRACAVPTANIPEMQAFADRNEDYLAAVAVE